MEKIEYQSASKLKKAVSCIFYVFLCLVSALSIIAACLVIYVSAKAPFENTLELFGYKIYTCDSDIEEADIKAGSLIIIKDTDNDEYYTPQALKQSAIVFENAGNIIKNHSTSAVLVALIPVMLFFVVVLMRELSKKIIKNGQKQLEAQIEFVEIDSFEIAEETQKN